jgi:hypothetical protein
MLKKILKIHIKTMSFPLISVPDDVYSFSISTNSPIHNQSAKSFTINIFGDDDQWFPLSICQFKGWNNGLYTGYLLLTQKQQRVIKFNFCP